MVQELFHENERLKAEIRRLKGRQDRVSAGGTLILTTTGGGTAPVPAALQGAIIRGSSTPGWERLVHPTPNPGEKYALRYDDGDSNVSWKIVADEVFIINMAAAL